MPILHVIIIMLAALSALAIFAAGVPWLPVLVALGICLLIIIALYRRT